MSNRSRIAQLAAENLTASEIARRLGLASPTVDYHPGRLAERAAAVEVEATPSETGRTQVNTREAVARLLARGL